MARTAELVAITSGGDWADASVRFLVIPRTVDLDTVRLEWDEWYREDYLPRLRRWQKDWQWVQNRNDRPAPPLFHDLTSWLCIHHGARIASDTEIEEYHDGP